MAFLVYVLSVMAAGVSYPQSQVLSLLFVLIALVVAFRYELQLLASSLRASGLNPRTDP